MVDCWDGDPTKRPVIEDVIAAFDRDSYSFDDRSYRFEARALDSCTSKSAFIFANILQQTDTRQSEQELSFAKGDILKIAEVYTDCWMALDFYGKTKSMLSYCYYLDCLLNLLGVPFASLDPVMFVAVTTQDCKLQHPLSE
jgi:hypothetical protein